MLPKLNNKDIKQIQAFHDNGMSGPQIAEKMNLNINTIYKYLNQIRNEPKVLTIETINGKIRISFSDILKLEIL